MLTPSFANNSRGMPCAIASEDASEDTSLDCWNYILLNCSIPTRTSFAASQMWVGIEKSCTYTEMCQHSLMASNGELSLEKDWFLYAEAKLLCDAIFVSLLPKLE